MCYLNIIISSFKNRLFLAYHLIINLQELETSLTEINLLPLHFILILLLLKLLVKESPYIINDILKRVSRIFGDISKFEVPSYLSLIENDDYINFADEDI